MRNIVVIGSQWGDEGKGKVVDLLADEADLVIRFNGGHNAGHTLVVGAATYKLALIPSGIVRGRPSLIGGGTVIDAVHFRRELESLAGLGIDIRPDLLQIADNATLILSFHRELDRAREETAVNGEQIGTTQRGIGPAYEDKAGRRAFRLADLRYPEVWQNRIETLCRHHDPLRLAYGLPVLNHDEVVGELERAAADLLPFAFNMMAALASDKKQSTKRLLFEGAQGALLDPDFGTYPYVTSSTTLAGAASIGTGVGFRDSCTVLGVTKAYCTRVGEGPFPTELFDNMGTLLGERGNEFGVNTGRKRRCGWLDAVALRYSARLNGMGAIALTKLDVLDGLPELKICTGYDLDGNLIDYLPSSIAEQHRLKPIYRHFDSWSSSTRDLRSLNRFPREARIYVDFIEEFVETQIELISTGPDRESTIVLTNPWAR